MARIDNETSTFAAKDFPLMKPGHSDHIPLIANIPLSSLGVAVKNIQQQAPATKRVKVLLRPIKKCDQERLQCALKDPTCHALHAACRG
jgi:hypothetical protein